MLGIMDSSKFNFAYFFLLFIYSCSGAAVSDLSQGLSEFANDLYLQCVKEQPGNVIVSPLSVSSALALLSQGAEGSTFEQLSQGLHLGNDKSITASQFLEHREALEHNLGESKLSIANRIYVQHGQQLSKSFEDVAVSKFKSGIESLNFTDAEKSAGSINHFVEEQTNGKIKDLIKADQLDANTRSVLVNAIYFKGDWEQPFNSELTEKSNFYNSETETVSVDFMYMDSDFNVAYINYLDATALEMKYASSNISLVIVLPNNRMGLSALETKLKDYDLKKIAETFYYGRCEVTIPKFKIEYEINLNDVLQNMGITEIFSDGSNLRGLFDSGEQLKVSDVVHKAFIEVSEKGTEAGASTAEMIVPYSIPPQFFANHPFLFYIRDTQTNTVIFNGRLEKL